MLLADYLNPLDADALRAKVRASKPFPNFCVDNFLREEFARAVVADYPSYSESLEMGHAFKKAVNEVGKVQVTDSSKFPPVVAQLNDLLASQEFLDVMSYVMDIPKLVADPQLFGGGIHQTGSRGRLDVHVDFNYIEDRALHRRLNILIYLNEGWQPQWGGEVELWDEDVKVCHHRLLPIFNRCVVFETNEISFHGVTAVNCPDHVARRSYAAYYYTKEAPAHWNGRAHSTIFKARPNEVLKGSLLMPAEKVQGWVGNVVRRTTRKVKKILG